MYYYFHHLFFNLLTSLQVNTAPVSSLLYHLELISWVVWLLTGYLWIAYLQHTLDSHNLHALWLTSNTCCNINGWTKHSGVDMDFCQIKSCARYHEKNLWSHAWSIKAEWSGRWGLPGWPDILASKMLSGFRQELSTQFPWFLSAEV